MISTTHTFQAIKASADYTCPCSGCGKVLKRKATAEHTINPFNVTEAGEVRTASEVRRRAQIDADAEAALFQDVPTVCRDCADTKNRELLLAMARYPHVAWPDPPKQFWGSPMEVLVERKHVLMSYPRCDCGASCCAGYKREAEYQITKEGLARAAKLQEKAA